MDGVEEPALSHNPPTRLLGCRKMNVSPASFLSSCHLPLPSINAPFETQPTPNETILPFVPLASRQVDTTRVPGSRNAVGKEGVEREW